MFAFLLIVCSSSASAHSAYTNMPASRGPVFHASIGFDTLYKGGTWVPIHITLSNNGADFSGMLSLNPPPSAGGSETSSSLYQVPVILPAGARKQITTSIPLDSGSPGVTQSIAVQLLDPNGNIVQAQAATARSLGAEDIFVGILSDQRTGFNSLNGVVLPNPGAEIVTEFLNESNFPTIATVLNNFNLIILDNFAISTLST